MRVRPSLFYEVLQEEAVPLPAAISAGKAYLFSLKSRSFFSSIFFQVTPPPLLQSKSFTLVLHELMALLLPSFLLLPFCYPPLTGSPPCLLRKLIWTPASGYPPSDHGNRTIIFWGTDLLFPFDEFISAYRTDFVSPSGVRGDYPNPPESENFLCGLPPLFPCIPGTRGAPELFPPVLAFTKPRPTEPPAAVVDRQEFAILSAF